MSVPFQGNIEAVPRNRTNNKQNQRPTSEVIDRPKQSQHRPKSQNIEPSTNIFINYIPPEYNENDLKILCSNYGEILCSKIMINLETGQSKCFGFVRFKELSQAQSAIRGINGLTIGNKRLLAKYAESHEKFEPISTMLYIKRLPLTIDINEILNIFKKFGEIIYISPHSIETEDPHYWRCFIKFNNQNSATKALNLMNNQIILPNTKPIHVKYADEKRLSGNFLIPNLNSFEPDERNLLPSFLFN